MSNTRESTNSAKGLSRWAVWLIASGANLAVGGFYLLVFRSFAQAAFAMVVATATVLTVAVYDMETRRDG